jgi:hypothetical protein
VRADGQFNVVWKTPGPIKAQPWSPFIPENKGKEGRARPRSEHDRCIALRHARCSLPRPLRGPPHAVERARARRSPPATTTHASAALAAAVARDEPARPLCRRCWTTR